MHVLVQLRTVIQMRTVMLLSFPILKVVKRIKGEIVNILSNVPIGDGCVRSRERHQVVKAILDRQMHYNTPCSKTTIYRLFDKHAHGINIFGECKGEGRPQICSDRFVSGGRWWRWASFVCVAFPSSRYMILVQLELWESVMVIIIFGPPLTYAYATLRQSVAGNSTFRGIVFCNFGTSKTVISNFVTSQIETPYLSPYGSPTIFPVDKKLEDEKKLEHTNVLIPWYPISYLTIASSVFFWGRLRVPTRCCD